MAELNLKDKTEAELIDKHVEIKNHKSQRAAEQKKENAAIDSALEAIENELLARTITTGLEGFKHNGYNAARREVVHYNTEDITDVYKFCLAEGDLSFLGARVSSARIKEHLEAGGELPPGLKEHREFKMFITKK